MNIVFRKSDEQDVNIIDQLLKTCFGDRSKCGAIDNLNSRYLLAFDNDKLIAMTGLDYNSLVFNGAEIDWTCILPEYRGRGIVVNMIKTVIRDCHTDIYCSCLRLHNSDRVNLYYAMQALGFECVVREYKKYNSRYDRVCDVCVHNTNNQCACCEDLYLRKSIM